MLAFSFKENNNDNIKKIANFASLVREFQI